MNKIGYYILFFSLLLTGCKQNKGEDNTVVSVQDSVESVAVSDEGLWYFEKPDYDEIEKRISDKNSNLYYPKLFTRYLNSDTFSVEEARHLYYGHVFQPDYNPYDRDELRYMESIQRLFDKSSFTDSDCYKMIEYADSLLKNNPFYLRGITLKMQMYEQLQDSISFHKVGPRIPVVFDAILSSGDGVSPETAFYVINPRNEYDVLNYMGFSSEGQGLIDHYDYLQLKENEAGLEGLYFDITPCLKYLNLPF